MIVQLSKTAMVPICSVWKQKGGWQPVFHEFDDPCLKSIMVSKSEIHLMTKNILKEYSGLMRLYNALKFIPLLYSIP